MENPAPQHPARRLWTLIEPIHAVTYFAPECRSALRDRGIRSFWNGYFAARSAPMGAVGAGVVTASFYNFSPDWVQRAVPAVWDDVTPADLLTVRSEAAATALRRLVLGIDTEATRILPLLNSAVRSAECGGRTIAAANQMVVLPDDPVAALWQCATTLREHRGDGHVAALVNSGIGGIESHLLQTGAGIVPIEVFRETRGWAQADWDAATIRLVARGVLDDDGRLTDEGHNLRDDIEATTDDLALQPYHDGLREAGLELLPRLLRPLAAAVADSGEIPAANPMGLDLHHAQRQDS